MIQLQHKQDHNKMRVIVNHRIIYIWKRKKTKQNQCKILRKNNKTKVMKRRNQNNKVKANRNR